MSTAGHPAEIALVALAVTALVGLLVRHFRTAARKTSPDALRVVLDPAAFAERAEREFTAMLLEGELTQAQYRTLVGALAEDCSSISRPARSTVTDHRRVS